MKIKHILITLAVVAAGVYVYTAITKKKRSKVIKDRGFEFEIEEQED